jgi:uncharacterized membrane protein
MQRDYDSHGDRGRFPTVFVAIAAVVIAVVVIIIAVFAYFSSTNSYYGNGYYGGHGMMGGFGGFSMLFMIPIVLILLVVIGYAIWRGCGWGRRRLRRRPLWTLQRIWRKGKRCGNIATKIR